MADRKDSRDERDRVDGAEQSGFIPKHGGYQSLLSYQKAQIVFDATVYFCKRFLNVRDRTYDQMVLAARSGKQNVVEGSQASGTSQEMEIKLTNFLLDRQLQALEQAFLKEGGLREAMMRARLAAWNSTRRKGTEGT